MTKKYFFAVLFLVIGVFLIYSGVNMALACDSVGDCTDQNNGAVPQTGFERVCIPPVKTDGTPDTISNCTCAKTGTTLVYGCVAPDTTKPMKCGTCGLREIATGLIFSGGSSSLPGQCLRLRAEVKIKDSIDPTGATKITFPKGAVIAAGPVSKDECRFYNDAGVEQKIAIEVGGQCKSSTGAVKDQPCWTKDFAIVSLLSTVNYFISWLFVILMAVVTIMIIYGGFLYITSAGSPEKAGKGKSVLTFALIGFAIALLARLLPGIIPTLFGLK